MALLPFLVTGCEEKPEYVSYDRDDDAVYHVPMQRFVGPELTYPAFSIVTQPFPGPGIALGDLDGDDDLDLLLAFGTSYSLGFRNDGTGMLELDDTILVDRGGIPGAQAVALADVDGDDDLDAFLGTPSGDVLLRNDGTALFSRESLSESGPTTTTGAFGDFDRDGDLDIFASRHVWPIDMVAMQRGTAVSAGHTVYVNEGGTFTSEAGRVPDAAHGLFSLMGAPGDIDADGDLDVYLLSDLGVRGARNVALVNDGAGTFSVADDNGIDVVLASHGASFADADHDGALDILTANIGPTRLFLGDGSGAFVESTAQMAVPRPDETHRTAWGATLTDFNGDGFDDAAVVYGKLFIDEGFGPTTAYDAVYDDDPTEQGDVYFENQGGRRFADASEESGLDEPAIGRSVAVGDLDRDGRPDLVTAGFQDLDLQPYLQTFRTDGGWGPGVTVAFAGEATPIGARVEGTADQEDFTRWFLPATTFSSSAPEVYVGLGNSRGTTALRVVWPDGEVTEVAPADSGERVVVRRVAE